jgi:hypothetical protein
VCKAVLSLSKDAQTQSVCAVTEVLRHAAATSAGEAISPLAGADAIVLCFLFQKCCLSMCSARGASPSRGVPACSVVSAADHPDLFATPGVHCCLSMLVWLRIIHTMLRKASAQLRERSSCVMTLRRANSFGLTNLLYHLLLSF